MADLIETKAAFPKSGGLAVADGAVSVNAGNGLHVNPSTGMVEVPVDTTAGLGYGSNGLEVEVDGSTIDFNSAGQLAALGGGGGISYFAGVINGIGIGTKFGNFTAYQHETTKMHAAFLYSDDWVLLVGCWRQVSERNFNILTVTNDAKDVAPQVNGFQTTKDFKVFGVGNFLHNDRPSAEVITANYSGYGGGAIISFNANTSYESFNTPILFTWNS